MTTNGITRRDFLNGIALPLASAGLLTPALGRASAGDGRASTGEDGYPPALTGLRGSHPGSFEVAHALARDGARWPSPARQTDDVYDLVVVGGGLSGLAAAYLFRQQAGPAARILVLDNHDDFGGHAKRNEFRVGDRTLLGYGGSQSIDSPGTYSRVAGGLLREIGVETARFHDWFDGAFHGEHGLRPGILFQSPSFTGTRLTGHAGRAADAAERERWLADYPISEAGRTALARLYAGTMNQSPAVRRALDDPGGTPAEDFLRAAFDMPDDALAVLRDSTLTFWGFGLDGLSLREVLDGQTLGPALNRAVGHAEALPPVGAHGEEPYIFHFPDGNATVARLLVRALIPQAIPGGTQEDVVTARARYDLLDRSEHPVRIRLSSTAVDVRNADAGVDVVYVRGGAGGAAGGVERVRARHAILACYNRIIPHLCPDLGGAQREALAYPEKIPLVVMNVALRQWRPLADSGFGNVYCPGGFLVRMGLDFPVSMPGYRFSGGPAEPVVLDCWHAAVDRDTSLHVFERLRRGRHAMLARPFEAYEAEARRQFDAAWGSHGFDAERDIAAITVNRWPHGYAWEYTDRWDDPAWSRGAGPHVIGRQQVGRISIANSDSEAFAYVNGAIDAAYRAVREQTTP